MELDNRSGSTSGDWCGGGGGGACRDISAQGMHAGESGGRQSSQNWSLKFSLISYQAATGMACFLKELIAQVKRKCWLNSTHHSILLKIGEIRGWKDGHWRRKFPPTFFTSLICEVALTGASIRAAVEDYRKNGSNSAWLLPDDDDDDDDETTRTTMTRMLTKAKKASIFTYAKNRSIYSRPNKSQIWQDRLPRF